MHAGWFLKAGERDGMTSTRKIRNVRVGWGSNVQVVETEPDGERRKLGEKGQR